MKNDEQIVKLLGREIEVNHKKIEMIDTDSGWNVSRFDNDRQKYTHSEDFETPEQAEIKYNELIDDEYEKMRHQF